MERIFWQITEQPRELIKKGNKEISEVEAEVEELTIEDVERGNKKLKNNKAAGTDGIRPELIKYGGSKLLVWTSKTNLGVGKDTWRMERNNNSSYTQNRRQR